MPYLVVIVPPDDANGSLANLPDIVIEVESIFAAYGCPSQIEVITDGT